MNRPRQHAPRGTEIRHRYRPSIVALSSTIQSRSHLPWLKPHKSHGLIPCQAAGVHALFASCTLYVIPFYILMICFPRSERTKRILISPNVLLPIAVAYVYLLVASWEKDTLHLMMPGEWKQGVQGFNPQFFPKLNSIRVLFSRVTTAASLWVHIVAVNFFFARHAYLEGLIKRIPTRHTCLIALFLGPLAIISSVLTEAMWKFGHEHKKSHKHRH